jgi:hypothetical protein
VRVVGGIGPTNGHACAMTTALTVALGTCRRTTATISPKLSQKITTSSLYFGHLTRQNTERIIVNLDDFRRARRPKLFWPSAANSYLYLLMLLTPHKRNIASTGVWNFLRNVRAQHTSHEFFSTALCMTHIGRDFLETSAASLAKSESGASQFLVVSSLRFGG